jgi:hypothetical protein
VVEVVQTKQALPLVEVVDQEVLVEVELVIVLQIVKDLVIHLL